MQQSDAQVLEIVDEISLCGIGESGFPDQKEGWMASLGAGFHYVFADVASPSYYQNLAFLSHWLPTNTPTSSISFVWEMRDGFALGCIAIYPQEELLEVTLIPL